MDKLELVGWLYLTENNYLVLVRGDRISIELTDTLIRSAFLGKRVKITVEETGEYG